jgi:hypothetical protein
MIDRETYAFDGTDCALKFKKFRSMYGSFSEKANPHSRIEQSKQLAYFRGRQNGTKIFQVFPLITGQGWLLS